MKSGYWLLIIMVMVSGACKDKFVLNTNQPTTGFLVVEGFINISGTTDMLLSRSSGLDTPLLIPELHAQLDIQSQNGQDIPLDEKADGHYTVDGLTLDPSQLYKLHIRLVNGKEYASDYSEAKITSPIDSLNWTANSDAVTIYVSTHDNQNQPGYYQWQFEETWKYTSAYESVLKYENHYLVNRPTNEQIYTCWRTDLSTVVDIASTEKLSANVIYKFPVTQVSYYNTDKLINQYSILVKQYALTKDWYEWNQKIKRNTEQVGSIFDAQPSETGGNIHCITDPSEAVIGFIGCTTETEKRLFIDRFEIPPTQIYNPYIACEKEGSSTDSTSIANLFGNGFAIPIQPTYGPDGRLIGYSGSNPQCVDCRENGGITVKPPYWP